MRAPLEVSINTNQNRLNNRSSFFSFFQRDEGLSSRRLMAAGGALMGSGLVLAATGIGVIPGIIMLFIGLAISAYGAKKINSDPQPVANRSFGG